MTPAEHQALEDVRGYGQAGRVRISRHAWRRMEERGAAEQDVWHALVEAKECREEHDERWRVESKDEEGDDLTLIVAFEDGVLVVTLF